MKPSHLWPILLSSNRLLREYPTRSHGTVDTASCQSFAKPNCNTEKDSKYFTNTGNATTLVQSDKEGSGMGWRLMILTEAGEKKKKKNTKAAVAAVEEANVEATLVTVDAVVESESSSEAQPVDVHVVEDSKFRMWMHHWTKLPIWICGWSLLQKVSKSRLSRIEKRNPFPISNDY
ncbi:hypothetical protein BCR33DRAFT_166510 [Rhizoclosmatium globosum]|uniref:Uncharacterized protein n=1 Tax=Rhizoclosmatium globosum TaxID=329046 RepID=A0A1Y2AHW0_9FUNG|nr:hypothetical protein BCR33DRAFT_166510 [Rhizoclosmatium globosum]|eukprot:ORY22052.1 hypothetical protein BCR33DRAFT_166510 [Rhizoclosmatium globosum]